ncbi:MAG: hypothetical protein VKM92_08345 [Cyanobacteriota bacterium]|nr:hypothetical protein [Cyanobacteriota bacterium]
MTPRALALGSPHPCGAAAAMAVFLWTLQFAGLAIVVLGLALERRAPLRRR